MSFDMAGLNIFDLEIQQIPRDLAFAPAQTKQKQRQSQKQVGLAQSQHPVSAFVGVADPNNIILAKIGSHLNLDNNDRIIGVVAKRVMGTKRNID